MRLRMEFVVRYGIAYMATLNKEGEYACNNSRDFLHAFGIF